MLKCENVLLKVFVDKQIWERVCCPLPPSPPLPLPAIFLLIDSDLNSFLVLRLEGGEEGGGGDPTRPDPAGGGGGGNTWQNNTTRTVCRNSEIFSPFNSLGKRGLGRERERESRSNSFCHSDSLSFFHSDDSSLPFRNCNLALKKASQPLLHPPKKRVKEEEEEKIFLSLKGN